MGILQMINFFKEIVSYMWNNVSSIEALISIGCVLGGFLYGIIIKMRNSNVRKYLEIWIASDALKSLKNYIDTRGQQIDPCENDEISEANSLKITKKLIPFFINEVFNNHFSNQYIVILGDSGTGKTTFMIQLFKTYRKKHLKKYKIEYIPLSYSTCINEINRIKEPSDTILLLDGLDENPEAFDNYEMFMKELMEATQLFYKIIISCRTQFFPNEKAEPYETGRIQIRSNMRGKKNLFFKLYISPFDDKDIKKFLKKKYPSFINSAKRKKAEVVIEKSPYLMVRPMLLSYIDDLIPGENEYQYVYQIYEQLTKSWMMRENVSYGMLYKFTYITARYMYDNNSNYIEATTISKICKQYKVDLTAIEAKSRSLLNRNGIGDYKFAHKSIYEYFLAKEALKSPEFREKHNFDRFDMARLFFKEMSSVYVEQEISKNVISGNFSILDLKDVDFRQKKFNGAVFHKSRIVNCDFSDCNLCAVDFDGCIFDHCILKNIILTETIHESIEFYHCDLSGILLNESMCKDVTFSSCILTNAIFTKTTFESIYFTQSELTGADFRYCVIKDGNFIDSKLQETNMKCLQIEDSLFSKSNMAYSDLSNAIVERNCFFETMIWAPIKYDNIQIDRHILADIRLANNLSEKLIPNNT